MIFYFASGVKISSSGPAIIYINIISVRILKILFEITYLFINEANVLNCTSNLSVFISARNTELRCAYFYVKI